MIPALFLCIFSSVSQYNGVKRWTKVNNKTNNLESIWKILPLRIRDPLSAQISDKDVLQEIRLRAGQKVLFYCDGQEHTLKTKENCMITPEEVQETIQYATGYSLYAYEQELKQGYITIEGGHRIGIAGQVIMEQNGVRNFRYISSVNIRVAHQVRGCADAVMPYLTSQGNVYSTLIIAPPGCGKTTLLRDMIRQIANGCDHLKGKTVGVVDERSELGGCYLGIRQNDLGVRTDLLDACPKADGMLMLIRSMGPEVIAVDEIGSAEEVGILRYAMHCGCRTLATVHGESYQEIRDKPLFEDFFRMQLFERYVVLCRGERIGQLKGVYDHQGTKIC